MKKIAIITARSGSKSLKNKNILELCGKPVIAWSIEAALQSKCFDRVIVTTDSEEYGRISLKYGAEVVYRSKEVSTDTSTTYDVLEELFRKVDLSMYDYFMLLQPTSPLRTEQHIKEAVELFEKNYKDKNTLVSVTRANKTSNLIREIDDSLSLKNFNLDYSGYRRQNYIEYETNGAIFMSKIDHYLDVHHFYGEKGIAYIMGKEYSPEIDDEIDFELIKVLLSKRLKKRRNRTI